MDATLSRLTDQMPVWDSIKGGWQVGDAINVASALVSANGNTGWIACETYSEVEFVTNVTAITGNTPTLTIAVLTADDTSGTNQSTVKTGSALTGTGTQELIAAGLSNYFEITWTLGGTGTPTATFSIAGIARP